MPRAYVEGRPCAQKQIKGGLTDTQSWLTRLALRTCNWSERWFPDAYVFAALAVVLVALVSMAAGASQTATTSAFGDGFWSLIPFTMQMCPHRLGKDDRTRRI